MAHRDIGTDWLFIGGISFAIASTVALAAIAVYILTERLL